MTPPPRIDEKGNIGINNFVLSFFLRYVKQRRFFVDQRWQPLHMSLTF